MKKAVLRVGLLLLITVLPQALAAQSCALCYTQAASAGARFIQGLRTGILILLFPPMLISVGITALTWKRRNKFQDPKVSENDLGW